MESPYKQQIQNQIQHIGQQGNLHGEIAVLLCPENGRTVVVQSNERIGQGRQREIIAQALGAQANEIYFTAGGSESDNWALKATAEAYEKKGKHIITTKIEHHAILHTCEYLEKQRGFEITYLDVDENGVVKLDELKKAIRPDTILISVMFANNEIGTIQPIREIGEIAQEHKILFHTDAVQAFGQIPIDVDAWYCWNGGSCGACDADNGNKNRKRAKTQRLPDQAD